MTYLYTDPDGDELYALPEQREGKPVIELNIHSEGSVSLGVHIPLDRVDEVIAGIRETARRAAA